MRPLSLVILFFHYILLVSAEGAPIINIEELSRDILLDEMSQYVSEGPYDTYSHQDFLNSPKLFTKLSSNIPSTNSRNSTYWILFDLEGELMIEEKLVLEFKDNRVNNFDIWINGKRQSNTSGTDHNFQNRKINHKSIVSFLPRENTNKILIRLSSEHAVFFDFAVVETYTFQEKSLIGYIVLGCCYGFVILSTILGFLLFLRIKKIKYIAFTLLSLIVLFTCLVFDGTGFQFLWPNSPSLNYIISNVQSLLLLYVSILYFFSFFDILDFRRFDFKVIAAITIVCSFLFVGVPYVQNIRLQTFIYSIPLFSLLPIMVREIKNDKSGAGRYLAAGLVLVFYGLIYYCIEQFVPLSWYNPFNRHSPHIAGLSIIVFSVYTLFRNMAFYSKTRNEERKKAYKLLQQLNSERKKKNEEISEKVKQQTSELEKKNKIISNQVLELENVNRELASKSQQINLLNTHLNIENEALKTDVEKIKNLRVLQNNIPFEDFREYFDSEEKCYTLLEQIKWPNHFVCTKCGNDKYGKGKGPHARRCTKCGSNDSVTSGTLFHRVHFPINKAFYILFLVNKHGEKLVSKQISETIDLRLATCWKFGKKIKTRKAEFLEEGKEVNSWVDIIV